MYLLLKKQKQNCESAHAHNR